MTMLTQTIDRVRTAFGNPLAGFALSRFASQPKALIGRIGELLVTLACAAIIGFSLASQVGS